MVQMLKDLREIGTFGDTSDDEEPVFKTIAMTPYAKAIESNLSAFFQYSPTTEVLKVIDLLKSWQEIDQNLPLPHFVHSLKRLTHRWTIYKARKNYKTKAFVRRHLLNVITKWPDAVAELSEDEKIKLAVRNSQKQLLRVAAKLGP